MQKHPWSLPRVVLLMMALLNLIVLLIGVYAYVAHGEITIHLVVGLLLVVPLIALLYWGQKKGYAPPIRIHDLPSTGSMKGAIELPPGMILAPAWRRVAAFLIDRTVSSVFLGLAIAIFIMMDVPAREFEATVLSVVGVVAMGVFFLMGSAYVVCRDVIKGQSIGRRILQMRVVQEDGQRPVVWWRAVLRDVLLRIFPVLIIEVIYLFADSQHRRLGDRLTKTVVVDIRETGARRRKELGR